MSLCHVIFKSVERGVDILIWWEHTGINTTLVPGSHLEQRIFAGTKWLGTCRYQVQASRFMAQVIVLVLLMQWLVMIEKLG